MQHAGNIEMLSQLRHFAEFEDRFLPFENFLFIGERIDKPVGKPLFSYGSDRTVDRLEDGTVAEKVQVQAERMFSAAFFRCSVESAEVIIQSFQLIVAE